ncbi:MAG: rhodanese-like domain-containing protein [Hyphomicrobiales bacterium]|nr:rhodanese-like domain-containing protein [Hyphomicrobiales bacterium]
MSHAPLKKGFKQLLAEANAIVESVDVRHALPLAGDASVQFVDVRDGHELAASGRIPGAVHAPRGFLEFIADPDGPMHKKEFSSGKKLVLFCATGGRSALAARQLMEMGFANVAHMPGGFAAWNAAGGPVER